MELTEAETVPAKALRSTAAADARVASFMVDVMVWSCLLCSENKIMILKKVAKLSFSMNLSVEHMNSDVDTMLSSSELYVAPVGSIDS